MACSLKMSFRVDNDRQCLHCIVTKVVKRGSVVNIEANFLGVVVRITRTDLNSNLDKPKTFQQSSNLFQSICSIHQNDLFRGTNAETILQRVSW